MSIVETFYKDGKMITICRYECGLMTMYDDSGKSIKINQSELYEPLKNYFDQRIVCDSKLG